VFEGTFTVTEGFGKFEGATTGNGTITITNENNQFFANLDGQLRLPADGRRRSPPARCAAQRARTCLRDP
jgi:hypothetical protein